MSAPTSLSDDVGVDFGCTLFHRLPGLDSQLIPTLPFAVQVKSSAGTVRLTKSIPLLRHMRIPFFVAVAQVDNGTLSLYSGRFLRFAFDLHGTPSSLTGNLTSQFQRATTAAQVTARTPHLKLRVNMPKLASLSVKSSKQTLDRVRAKLESECQETGLNNYQSAIENYVFRFSRPRHTHILAGSGSAQQFRHAMADRLAEYARNLEWLDEERGQRHVRERQAFVGAAQLLRPFLPQPLHFQRAFKAVRDKGAV